MTVNIWKSCMWTADKEINMKAIFAVMNSSWAVLKIRPENTANSAFGFSLAMMYLKIQIQWSTEENFRGSSTYNYLHQTLY